jgi:Na+/proline symporter
MARATTWLNAHTAFLWFIVVYLLVVVLCAALGHVYGTDQPPPHGVQLGSTS